MIIIIVCFSMLLCKESLSPLFVFLCETKCSMWLLSCVLQGLEPHRKIEHIGFHIEHVILCCTD
jgi:hypothetical protein